MTKNEGLDPNEVLWRERLARELEREMLWLVPNIAERNRDVFRFTVTTCADIIRNGAAKDRKETTHE